MDSKKVSINIFLACCAVLLALTTITTAYFKYGRQQNHPNTTSQISGSASSAMPANSEVASQVKNLDRLMAENPGNPNYPTQIGNLLYDHGEFEKAAVYYEKSLNIRPQDPGVETDLAVCFHYIGKDDKALEILNRVIGYRPDFSPAKFNKGMVLINGKKDIQGGISVWEDLLRSDPGLPNKQELEQRIRELKGSSGQ